MGARVYVPCSAAVSDMAATLVSLVAGEELARRGDGRLRELVAGGAVAGGGRHRRSPRREALERDRLACGRRCGRRSRSSAGFSRAGPTALEHRPDPVGDAARVEQASLEALVVRLHELLGLGRELASREDRLRHVADALACGDPRGEKRRLVLEPSREGGDRLPDSADGSRRGARSRNASISRASSSASGPARSSSPSRSSGSSRVQRATNSSNSTSTERHVSSHSLSLFVIRERAW